MYSALKQFVPSKFCLACDGCCRFREAQSCWRPKVTASERAAVSLAAPREKIFDDKVFEPLQMIRTIPWQTQNICYFFQSKDNTCGIYPYRPFECRLYPFVITGQKEDFVLSVHLACPYIQEKRYTPDFDVYVNELREFFKKKATKRFLQEYLRLNHSYPGFDKEFETLFSLSLRDLK